MEINSDQNSYDIDKLYFELLPITKKIYKKYDYVKISNEQFKILTLNAIKNCINILDYSLFIIEYQKQLNILIKKYIKKLIEEPENFKIIINDYINKNLDNVESYDGALKKLEKLSDFFEDIEYYSPPNVITYICKENQILKKILSIVLDRNRYINEIEELYDIFNYNIITQLINEYCKLNGIKYNNSKYDAVSIYLNEIVRIPLLSEEESNIIYQKIENGDEEAKKILVNRNLRLVVKIAKNYKNRGLDFLDVIEAGNGGLISAVEHFDSSLKFKFSTYATKCIHTAIKKEIAETSRNIRIPNHIFTSLYKYYKVRIVLENELNREPSDEEVAHEMGISIKKLKIIKDALLDTVSLNALISEDEDDELEIFIPSENYTDETVINKLLKEDLKNLLLNSNLSEREINIIKLSYYDDKSSGDISKFYGISRSRVNKILNDSLKKLAKNKNAKKLASYTDNEEEALQYIESIRKQKKSK